MMGRREPKTNRARRVLKNFAPKVLENPKTALFFKGNKCSNIVKNVMNDLCQMKKPHAIRFWKKNDIYPFETTKNVEFLGFKNDCSLFCFGNHQKKRPNNIIFGRMFDWQVLDMVEMGIAKYEPMQSAKGLGFQLGSKPMICFLGSHFQSNIEVQRVQNMFLDFFRGQEVKSVNLAGLDRLIAVTAQPPNGQQGDPNSAAGFKFLFKQYYVQYKKSTTGGTLPSVELKLVGPSIDFVLRRTKLSDADGYRRACVIPKQVANVGKYDKNISKDDMQNLRGQIHVGETDLSKLALRKFKANRVAKKRRRDEKEAAEAEANPDVGLDVAPKAARGPKPKRRRGNEEVPEDERMRFELVKPKLRVKKDSAERTLFVKANRKKKTKGNM